MSIIACIKRRLLTSMQHHKDGEIGRAIDISQWWWSFKTNNDLYWITIDLYKFTWSQGCLALLYGQPADRNRYTESTSDSYQMPNSSDFNVTWFQLIYYRLISNCINMTRNDYSKIRFFEQFSQELGLWDLSIWDLAVFKFTKLHGHMAKGCLQ